MNFDLQRAVLWLEHNHVGTNGEHCAAFEDRKQFADFFGHLSRNMRSVPNVKSAFG